MAAQSKEPNSLSSSDFLGAKLNSRVASWPATARCLGEPISSFFFMLLNVQLLAAMLLVRCQSDGACICFFVAHFLCNTYHVCRRVLSVTRSMARIAQVVTVNFE